jgi:5-methylthioadenosine/S-adenosylhomocysteine deaminase
MTKRANRPTSPNNTNRSEDQKALNKGSLSRRDLLKAGLVGAAAGSLLGPNLLAKAAGPVQTGGATPMPAGGGLTLLKGGVVMSMDDEVGDFAQGDVLIEGKRILDVRPNIDASAAQIIDASGMVVMPGFINTHHHRYETIQRSIIADGIIVLDESGNWPAQTYTSVVQDIWTAGQNEEFDLGRSPYDPEDNYISELIAGLNQINAGVTTGIDTSQSSHTPEYTDALIQGIIDSGMRTLFAYSAGRDDMPGYEYPGEAGNTQRGLGRLKSQFFSSDDQLITLGLGGGVSVENIQLARAFDVPLISHAFAEWGAQGVRAVHEAGLLGPDMVIIHATQWPDEIFELLAEAGVHLSIATPIEMQMRHGMPPIQQALDHGILPSLSPDVETNMTADPFTIMRSTFTLQRALLNERYLAGEENLPQLLTSAQVLRMATIAGARAAQLGDKVGSLTPGKEADVVMLDAQHINTIPMNNAPGTVVTMMDTSNVKHVFIAGQIKKWNGELVGVDIDSLRQRVEASRDRVLARIRSAFPEYRPSLFRSCCVPYDSAQAAPTRSQ